MNNLSLTLALRLIHVISGVLWTGAVVFIAWFLLPATRASGPAGGAVTRQLVRVQRQTVYLVTVMLLTVISGLILYQHDNAAFGAGWMRTGPGMTLATGALLAIIAAVLALAVGTPIAKRLEALGESVQAGGRPPSAEQSAAMAMLQTRFSRAMSAVAVLLLLATAAMAVARYIP